MSGDEAVLVVVQKVRVRDAGRRAREPFPAKLDPEASLRLLTKGKAPVAEPAPLTGAERPAGHMDPPSARGDCDIV